MSTADPSAPKAAGGAAGRAYDGPGGGRRALHVIFVVDGSGSMAGERVASLNWAARAAVPAMSEAAAEHPDLDVFVRVMRFADAVEWPQREPVRLQSFTWTNIAAGGETSMGAAFHALAEALSSLTPGPSDPPPVIILVSDGYPTDDAEAGLKTLLSTKVGGEAVRIAISIGSDADLDLLAAFIGDPAVRPLRASSAEALAGRIRWAASAPIAAAGTSPQPSGGESDAGLVW